MMACVLVVVQIVVGVLYARRAQAKRSGETMAHEAIFASLDEDFSGSLGSEELTQLLGVPVDVAEKLLRQYDADRSGRLDVEEFRELLRTQKIDNTNVLIFCFCFCFGYGFLFCFGFGCCFGCRFGFGFFCFQIVFFKRKTECVILVFFFFLSEFCFAFN